MRLTCSFSAFRAIHDKLCLFASNRQISLFNVQQKEFPPRRVPIPFVMEYRCGPGVPFRCSREETIRRDRQHRPIRTGPIWTSCWFCVVQDQINGWFGLNRVDPCRQIVTGSLYIFRHVQRMYKEMYKEKMPIISMFFITFCTFVHFLLQYTLMRVRIRKKYICCRILRTNVQRPKKVPIYRGFLARFFCTFLYTARTKTIFLAVFWLFVNEIWTGKRTSSPHPSELPLSTIYRTVKFRSRSSCSGPFFARFAPVFIAADRFYARYRAFSLYILHNFYIEKSINLIRLSLQGRLSLV